MGAPRKYPDELRVRAVRMVVEIREQEAREVGKAPKLSVVVRRVGDKLGIVADTLRGWVNQAEIDSGRRVGLSTSDNARIVELEKENRELRRANEILREAATFFARELDPRPRW